jgi:hypothetical protein
MISNPPDPDPTTLRGSRKRQKRVQGRTFKNEMYFRQAKMGNGLLVASHSYVDT